MNANRIIESFEIAGVKIENDSLNMASQLLEGSEFTAKDLSTAYKYAVIYKYHPSVLSNFDVTDGEYYSNWFWKIYPENEEDTLRLDLIN